MPKKRVKKQDFEVIFLAMPYQHSDPKVVEKRIEILHDVIAFLMKSNKIAIAPCLNHSVVKRAKIQIDPQYWAAYSAAHIPICSRMFVLTMEGWDQSSGIEGEIQLAKKFKIPVEFVDVSDFFA